MEYVKGILKEYDGVNGHQLDLISREGGIQINCGYEIELFILEKRRTIPIEMDNRYYGFLDGYKIVGLNGKEDRIKI